MPHECKPGLYRHFKGNLYQVLGIARHSETQEELVVYQDIHGEHAIWARPIEMFLGPVDHEKYPDCPQQDRFLYLGDSSASEEPK